MRQITLGAIGLWASLYADENPFYSLAWDYEQSLHGQIQQINWGKNTWISREFQWMQNFGPKQVSLAYLQWDKDPGLRVLYKEAWGDMQIQYLREHGLSMELQTWHYGPVLSYWQNLNLGKPSLLDLQSWQNHNRQWSWDLGTLLSPQTPLSWENSASLAWYSQEFAPHSRWLGSVQSQLQYSLLSIGRGVQAPWSAYALHPGWFEHGIFIQGGMSYRKWNQAEEKTLPLGLKIAWTQSPSSLQWTGQYIYDLQYGSFWSQNFKADLWIYPCAGTAQIQQIRTLQGTLTWNYALQFKYMLGAWGS